MGNAMPNEASPTRLLVTMSWDDGHPADLHLTELLAKHGASATLYVPTTNAEGKPVMQPLEIRQLAQHFQIGGHSRNHVNLTQLALRAAAQEIISNKEWLEDLLGQEIHCFAYVRGYHNRRVRRLVRDAGFRYARTVTTLSDSFGPNRYLMPTTLQFFPHRDRVYIKNYLSGGPSLERLALLRAVLRGNGLLERLHEATEACLRHGGHLHIWGHSWELKEYDLWDDLDGFLTHLRQLGANFVTNGALWATAGPISRVAQQPALPELAS
jgi:peptidoglycan/xylan/chitin deacetylase (PgdA/CDA1 family)